MYVRNPRTSLFPGKSQAKDVPRDGSYGKSVGRAEKTVEGDVTGNRAINQETQIDQSSMERQRGPEGRARGERWKGGGYLDFFLIKKSLG